MAQKQERRPMETVTSTTLKKTYGPHAALVLKDYLESIPQPKKRGVKKKWNVLKPLPSKDVFYNLRDVRFTATVQDLVSDAFGEFQDLGTELQEWYDNLPESFQQGDKGNLLEEGANSLSGLDQPEVPERIGDIKTIYVPDENVSSRADRCSDAIGRLHQAVEALNEAMEEEDDDGKPRYSQEEKDDMQSLIDELENSIGEAEGVEFPNMYG